MLEDKGRTESESLLLAVFRTLYLLIGSNRVLNGDPFKNWVFQLRNLAKDLRSSLQQNVRLVERLVLRKIEVGNSVLTITISRTAVFAGYKRNGL